ncbi:MAG TPA: hypothetical protein VFU14_20190 [Acidimicrobiales bacterium]|nr:hypothetical protein [Acidimicrobiales bacterium]
MKLDWTLTWGDRTFTIADLSAGDAAVVQELTGDGWRSLDPTAGPNHAGNLLTVLVARAEGKDPADVEQSVARLPVLDLLAALTAPAPTAAD